MWTAFSDVPWPGLYFRLEQKCRRVWRSKWQVQILSCVEPGCSVTTVILQVSHGKRPSMEMLPDEKPPECGPLIGIMQQCWDQDHRKRPHFAGMDFSSFILHHSRRYEQNDLVNDTAAELFSSVKMWHDQRTMLILNTCSTSAWMNESWDKYSAKKTHRGSDCGRDCNKAAAGWGHWCEVLQLFEQPLTYEGHSLANTLLLCQCVPVLPSPAPINHITLITIHH